MNEYITFDKAILRYPTNSFGKLMDALNGETQFQSAIGSDEFDEALLYVSPDLYSEFQKYKSGSLSPKDAARMARTLYKYYSRSCTRSTPFGAWAYCTVAGISPRSNHNLCNYGKPSLYFTFDMAFLQALSNKFLIDGCINDENAVIHRNPTLYRVDRNWNYYYQETNGNISRHEAGRSKVLDYVIGHMLDKPVTIIEFKRMLSKHYEMSDKQMMSLIYNLVNTQIVISDNAPNVIGENYYDRLSHIAEHCGEDTKKVFAQLESILNRLNTAKTAHERKQSVFDLWSIASEAGIKTPKKSMLHIDAFEYNSEKNISSDIVRQIFDTCDFLSHVTPVYANSRLSRFASRFTTRYESETVPLLELFDSRTGIGYDRQESSVIDPLVMEVKLPGHQRNRVTSLNLTPFQMFLLNRIIENGKGNSINLNNTDLKEFYITDNCHLGLSQAAMFRLICHDDKNPVIDSPSFSGVSGAKLAGRFCNGCNEIDGLVRRIVSEEQSSSRLPLAEIAHYSNAHVGNISERPKFRDVTLDCLSYTDSCSLPLNDLSVRIVGGHIELLSERLGCPILPRLTTAHNYSISQWPIYRFLCDLQSQDVQSGLSFNWGGIKQLIDRTPRIIYNNVVLSRASWRIKIQQIFKGNKPDRIAFMDEIRRMGLPRFLLYSEGDNTLFIDMESRLSVESFLSNLKTPHDIELEEFFPTDEILSYDTVNTLECIIPFKIKEL